MGQRGAVADGFRRLPGACGRHRGVVQAVGVGPQGLAGFAQHPAHGGQLHAGDVPNGVDAELLQGLFRVGPHKQQSLGGQLPDDGLHLLPAKDGDGVGLFVIAAQLGEHLVVRHPDGHGEAQLLLHRLADLLGNLLPVAEEPLAAVDVQPALVQAEGLHLVGEAVVDFLGHAGILQVPLPVGRHQLQIWALALGLPDGLRCLDAHALCQHVFGQDDAVAALLVPGHSHGHVLVLRRKQCLHRGVEVVHVHVQDAVFQKCRPLPLCSERAFVLL